VEVVTFAGEAESVAVSVKVVAVRRTEGVPLITPVAELIANPVGNVGLTT